MATIQFDDSLDAAIEQHVPAPYRGDRKTGIRADYVAREWLRDKSQGNGSGVAGRSSGTNANDPADRPVKSS